MRKWPRWADAARAGSAAIGLLYSPGMPSPALLASVEVPASSANLGSGFDCFAAALSLKLRAEQRYSHGLTSRSRPGNAS